jgi:hypothetical protein
LEDCGLWPRWRRLGSIPLAQSSSAAPRAASCATAEGGDAHARDTLLAELRAWVGGLERIGDAEQVVVLLVESEVSLANLGSFTVDESTELAILLRAGALRDGLGFELGGDGGFLGGFFTDDAGDFGVHLGRAGAE